MLKKYFKKIFKKVKKTVDKQGAIAYNSLWLAMAN